MSSNCSNPVPLADLVEDKIGGLWGDPPDSAEPDNIAVLVIRGADFRDWSSRRAANAARRTIPRRALARRELRLGDLVLEVSGGGPSQPVGRVVVIDGETLDSAAHPLIPSNFCRRIRLKPGANPYFVKRQLDSLYRSGHFDQYQTSTTNIRNLQVDAFLDGTVLELPAPEEQVRLTKFADDFDSRTTSVQSHLSLALNCMHRFRQSVLAAACSGQLTADWRNDDSDGEDTPVSWQVMPLADLAARVPRAIQSGPFGSNLLHSEFVSTGRLVIGIDNVLDGAFSMGRNHRISQEKFDSLRKYEARPLDVLITVMGTVGRVCIVPADIEPALITKHVYRITINRALANPAYVALAMRGHPLVRGQIREQERGQTRPGINGTIVKALELTVPPLVEQDEIIRRVDLILSRASALDARLRRVHSALELTTRTILSKAFSANSAHLTAAK